MRLVKEVLLIFLVCSFLVSAVENETVVKGKPVVKKISLCEGCMIGDTCIGVGTQKRETVNSPLYYCGPDQKGFPAKDIGEICSEDYECVSYICMKGLCNAELEEGSRGILIAVLVGVIVILGLFALLLFKLGIGVKKISEEEQKMEKLQKKPSWQASVQGIKPGKYRYRPEYDVLEKKLRQKFKR